MTAKVGTDVAKREFLHTVVESVNLFLFSGFEISLKVSPPNNYLPQEQGYLLGYIFKVLYILLQRHLNICVHLLYSQ